MTGAGEPVTLHPTPLQEKRTPSVLESTTLMTMVGTC